MLILLVGTGLYLTVILGVIRRETERYFAHKGRVAPVPSTRERS